MYKLFLKIRKNRYERHILEKNIDATHYILSILKAIIIILITGSWVENHNRVSNHYLTIHQRCLKKKFFLAAPAIRKFPGQGLNLSRSNGNAESLMTRPPRNSQRCFLKLKIPSTESAFLGASNFTF